MQNIVTNQNIKSFNSVSNQEIENFFKAAIEGFQLVDFYYSGSHSTDSRLISVLPLHLLNNKGVYQLEAVKLVDGEFVMRRYFITGMSDISFGEDVRQSVEWKLVESEKDVLFPEGSSNQNAVLTINWNDWSNNMNSNMNSQVDVVQVEGYLGVLPSNQENLIIYMENQPLIYANNESIVSEGNVKIPKDVLIPVKVSTLQTIENFRVGNKVAINTDSKYFIATLSLTVVKINKERGMLTCVGFNKKREMYQIDLPANVMKTLFTQNN